MKRLASLLLVVFLVTTAAAPALAGDATPAPGARPLPDGSTFPDVTLTGPLNPDTAKYLGVAPDQEKIPLNDIQADVLLVELFSIYCPYCQNDAHNVEDIDALVSKMGLTKRIKIIGIGVDNTDAEIEMFKKRFVVSFPLFPDAGGFIHENLGSVGTPFFYVLRKQADGSFKVASSNLGTVGDPVAFLARTTRKAGM